MTDRITDEKLKNKRFKKTEEAIIMAFFLNKDKLNLKRLLYLAKISRSTLYRHHRNINEIAPDYEKYILKKCKNYMKPFMKKDEFNLKTLYQRILVFMVANRFIVNYLLKYNSHDFIERIIKALRPIIVASDKVDDGEMFKIYTKEVAAIIEEWCRLGFKKEDILPTTNKIMFLTDQAYIRLSPLRHFNKD
ncbi:hypothetical protein IKD67_00280 [Candidatus Saccharibacteria bacterium]|nr:hypothetical protein [Candidatus Saccharibacteria bacterium]